MKEAKMQVRCNKARTKKCQFKNCEHRTAHEAYKDCSDDMCLLRNGKEIKVICLPIKKK